MNVKRQLGRSRKLRHPREPTIRWGNFSKRLIDATIFGLTVCASKTRLRRVFILLHLVTIRENSGRDKKFHAPFTLTKYKARECESFNIRQTPLLS
jgi:hypothetical protein